MKYTTKLILKDPDRLFREIGHFVAGMRHVNVSVKVRVEDSIRRYGGPQGQYRNIYPTTKLFIAVRKIFFRYKKIYRSTKIFFQHKNVSQDTIGHVRYINILTWL